MASWTSIFLRRSAAINKVGVNEFVLLAWHHCIASKTLWHPACVLVG